MQGANPNVSISSYVSMGEIQSQQGRVLSCQHGRSFFNVFTHVLTQQWHVKTYSHKIKPTIKFVLTLTFTITPKTKIAQKSAH